MNTFSTSWHFLAGILIASLQVNSYGQEKTPQATRVAPVLPEALVSAADAFRSKATGQRLSEGWQLLSLIRRSPFEEHSKGPTNFWFGPLVTALSKSNLTNLLGRPDLAYTNDVLGTNILSYVYTCGWDPEGLCMEFNIDLVEPPMVWLHQNSIISTAEATQYRKEVLARFKPHYDKIIAALRAGELKPDATGRLRVPSTYPVVSMSREAYVSRQTNGLLVAFKLWSGRRYNMEGYLYSDVRLADTQIGDQPELRIGPLLVAVEQRIDDHWYVIAYRCD